MPGEQPAAAGWYPDPEQVDTVRYWDGSAWTEQRAPTQTSRTTTLKTANAGHVYAHAGAGLLVGGWLLAGDARVGD